MRCVYVGGIGKGKIIYVWVREGKRECLRMIIIKGIMGV